MSKKVVTVYRKKPCVQCDATERWLTQHEIDFEIGDAVENAEVFKGLLNLMQAPIVKVFDTVDHTVTFWSGHNPIMLEKYLK